MSKLQVFHDIPSFLKWRKSLTPAGLGFVPTMGALHEGHRSLIQKSTGENEFTVVSVFVNPTQFNNPEDLKKYPRTLEKDLQIVEKAGGSCVFAPAYEQMYADDYRYQLSEKSFSKVLCGAHRPGHFDGVLTVVMKLLQIVRADRAYFGEKDYQQYLLIRDMVKSFFVSTEIIGLPTVREADGLALSSRNVRLTPEGRKKAPLLFETLKTTSDFKKAQAQLAAEKIELEYLEEHFNRRFIAAHIDGVRLIDNVSLI